MSACWECILTGTGTSVGVPQAGCDCAVCRSTDPRNRRLRASAILRELPSPDDHAAPPAPPAHDEAGGSSPDVSSCDTRAGEAATVVIDAGMDFRAQLLAVGVRRLDGVVFTHDHVDHIGGLDDVRPFCHYQNAAIPVFGSPQTLAAVRWRYDYIWNSSQVGGGLPRLELVVIDGPFRLAGLEFIPLPVKHGRLDILGFRVGDFAYITDASEIPEATFELLSGVRRLVLGAVQWEPHSTHFNIAAATAAARRIGALATYFTHMNHALDHARLAAVLPEGVYPGEDGLRLPLAGSHL